jgi:hypothetical protein
MSNNFNREERYIVIKRKHISEGTENGMRRFMMANGIEPIEAVVIERDWPEYETAWSMITKRCAA